MVLSAVLGAGAARGVTVTGADWRVHYNLPDQKTGANSVREDEYVLRNVWLERINELQSGDWACLSTYTFSGNSESCGAAGPILEAMGRALDRGAKVGFVVGYGVNLSSNFWPGVSLKGLAGRKKNPLALAQGPGPSQGIMHHKMGVFARKEQVPWVLAGSWNFTGGACSQQWNVLTEIRNAALAAACSNELSQLLAGRFHGSEDKSHAMDGATFRLAGATRDGWVRFAPYPEGKYGGNNALTDIMNAIAEAKEEIFFGLNKLTRPGVADALIAACDRGVRVHGAVAASDWNKESKDSFKVMEQLLDPKNYKTANRVRIYPAYTTDGKTAEDGGQMDLIHAKYMVIDPWGESPMVIQGSANWTATALVSATAKTANDEDIQFLPHAGIARAFAGQFGRMTDGMLPIVTKMERKGTGWTLGYWHAPGDGLWLETTGALGDGASWRKVENVSAVRQGEVAVDGAGDGTGFFRISGE